MMVRSEPAVLKRLMVYLLQPPQWGSIEISYQDGEAVLIEVRQTVKLPKGAGATP